MTRLWRIAGLAAVLLFAQTMSAAHGFDHMLGGADGTPEACIECLVLAGIQGAPSPALPGPVGLPVTTSTEYVAVSPAPTIAFLAVFRSRAPPIHQS